MPVSTLAFVVLTALLLTPALVQAQSRVVIKHPYQLDRAPEVKAAGESYAALAGAYVLYDQCGKELNITDAQKAYLTDKFTKVARHYQIAYQDAYVTYVGSSPSQVLVNDIAASIKKQQEKAVNNTALLIRKKGCQSERFLKIKKYVDRLYANDTAPPADPLLLEPRAKFGKKQ